MLPAFFFLLFSLRCCSDTFFVLLHLLRDTLSVQSVCLHDTLLSIRVSLTQWEIRLSLEEEQNPLCQPFFVFDQMLEFPSKLSPLEETGWRGGTYIPVKSSSFEPNKLQSIHSQECFYRSHLPILITTSYCKLTTLSHACSKLMGHYARRLYSSVANIVGLWLSEADSWLEVLPLVFWLPS